MADATRHSLLLLLVASSAATLPSHAQLWDNEALPVVLTPARLKQSRSEVPASVSVIDRQMIIASGIRRIPELFRLIPGTSVGARDGWNHVVSYHGTNYRDSRRMQVLVDGRSIYQAGLATVNWNDIPLAIEDIERIEVVRGPSTASYGANAFLGVINIITRHPDDADKLYLQARKGDNQVEDYLLSHAGSFEGGKYRLSLQSRRDDGFEVNRDGEDRRDSDNSDTLNLRYEKALDQANISLAMGYKQGWVTDDFADIDVTSPDTRHRNHFVSAKMSWDLSKDHHQHLRIDYSGQKQQKEWQAVLPPAFIGQPTHPSPLVRVDANENSRQTRQDIEFQDTMVWSPDLKTVAGIHIKHNRVSSETYYDGSRRSDSIQLFANAEYRISDHVTGNVGASWERDSNDNKDHLSPRVSLHYHLNNHHSFRAVYSEAVRSPDLLETTADWTYRAKNITPTHNGQTTGEYVVKATGNPDLRAEKISSREIGYYANFQHIGLQWDIKLFRDHLSNLVSDSTALDKFSPENSNRLRQQGIETELDYRPSPNWLFHASYAYINSDTTTQNEESFTPSNNFSALLSYKFLSNTQLSLSRYYSQNTRRRGKNTFSRSDLRLAHTLNLRSTEVQLAYVARYQHDDNSELLSDNFYREELRQLFTLSLRY